MVWGCFAAGGVGAFIQVKGILVKEKYRFSFTTLFHLGHVFWAVGFCSSRTTTPSTQPISSRITSALKKRMALFPFCRGSADLRKILDDHCDDRNPQNHAQLFATLKDGWESLPQNKLNSLVESMPRRCQAVINAKGYPTKY